jgi:hypothetical protein
MAEPPGATISTRILTRVIVLLIAAWSLVAGLVLLGFQGGASTLGGGIEDPAGQRLVGAQMLILVPAYLLLAWRPERYAAFMWLPFVSQLAVALVVSYSMLAGDTDFEDGALAAAAGYIFATLLGFVWVSEARSVARQRFEAPQRAGSEPGNTAALPGDETEDGAQGR